ncbi:MAG TPA: DUF4262 domain-containing protein [Verrucomicrobiae bacterium]|jgi:hypothetical protein|nr:DUF4262 domain-containing protein [Verrucomicrobiae bacterium]
MTNEVQKRQMLERIRENIARSGQHVYVVSGGETPRFAYTIGVSESVGVELILAGAIFYMKDEVVKIINDIATQLKAQRDRELFEVTGRGSFTLRKVHSSWAAEFMLGAFDYYQKRDIPALQIVPDEAHWTIDVPDMSAPWSTTKEPVWQWLHEPWTYPVPKDATAATNLSALRGDRITEVMRWEEDEWEMFAGAGPDVPKDEMRVVSLGTLVAADISLAPVMNLAIEEGLWRGPDPDSEWHPWRKRQQGIVQ